jgi:predicted metal-dependent hydrolase
MDTPRLPHQIERTKNKHSRAVYVGDTVVIRLARNLTKREETLHIEYLLKRMHELVRRERQKHAIHPFQPLLEGAQTATVHLADSRTITITLRPGARTRLQTRGPEWTLTVAPGLRRSALHRLLWRTLSAELQPRLAALVEQTNTETLRVPVHGVRVAVATSQWGSCSSRGLIMLNTALAFLPERLVRYVIIHELAHRLVQGHNAHFWSVVQQACPDYRDCVKALKGYRLPRL